MLSLAGFMDHFCWLTGHVSIHGNDLADIAAVSSFSITSQPLFFQISIPLSVLLWTKHSSHSRVHRSLAVWSLSSVSGSKVYIPAVTRKLCRRVSALGDICCVVKKAPVCNVCNMSLIVRYLLFVCQHFGQIHQFYFSPMVLPDDYLFESCFRWSCLSALAFYVHISCLRWLSLFFYLVSVHEYDMSYLVLPFLLVPFFVFVYRVLLNSTDKKKSSHEDK